MNPTRRTRGRVALGLLAALVGLPAAATAEQTVVLDTGGGPVELFTRGEYRFQVNAGSAIPVDAEGTELDQGLVLDHRLRARIGMRASFMTLDTEWDLFTGQLAGDTWGIPGTLDQRRRWTTAAKDGISALTFTPRRGAVRFDFDEVTAEFGLVTSDWGLGLLANGGDRDPYFGRNDFGDRVLRARATFRPLVMNKKTRGNRRAAALNITAAFDYVIEEDTSVLADGQRAIQGILSALWFEPEHCRHGVYLVYRRQVEPDSETTDALVVDGLLDQWFTLGPVRLRLAGEAALIAGRTDRAPSWNAPDDVRILQAAATGLATASLFEDKLAVTLRGGWASGDADPDDAVASDFTFDRDFDVGQVLFDEVMGGINAAAYNLVTDPENTGTPAKGVDLLVNEGAAARTVFLQPIVQGRPLPFLMARAGVLLAWASAPVRHPFYSFRAGGASYNHHDEPADERYLGTEIDWAVELTVPFQGYEPDDARFQILVQGGHAVLGEALRRDDGSDPAVAHRLLATARMRW